MKIMKPGVNYCHCPCCHTEFFFNEKDIYTENILEMPAVSCPYCTNDISIGFHNRFFTYKEPDEREIKDK